MQRSENQTLTCVECERTWERPRQGGRPPRRCPSCAQGRTTNDVPICTEVVEAPAPRPTTTGVACRVCGVDDGEERAQADLHLACVEQATDKAKKRAATGKKISATKRAHRSEKAGVPLDRKDLIRRLAMQRAGLIGTSRRGRPPRARVEQGEQSDDEAIGLTSDEVDAIDRITRGGGLATEGLE